MENSNFLVRNSAALTFQIRDWLLALSSWQGAMLVVLSHFIYWQENKHPVYHTTSSIGGFQQARYWKFPPLLWAWTKRPITWGIFNPGVELNPVDQVAISALSVIQNSITIKRTITWQNFQAKAEFKILSCNRFNSGLTLFMSYSSMHGSDYLLQKNNIEAMELLFLLPEINAGMRKAFQSWGWNRPCIIAKNFNPFNRTEFYPGLCNRPLIPQNRAAERFRRARGKTSKGGPMR